MYHTNLIYLSRLIFQFVCCYCLRPGHYKNLFWIRYPAEQMMRASNNQTFLRTFSICIKQSEIATRKKCWQVLLRTKNFYIFFRFYFYVYFLAGCPVIRPAGYPVSGQDQYRSGTILSSFDFEVFMNTCGASNIRKIFKKMLCIHLIFLFQKIMEKKVILVTGGSGLVGKGYFILFLSYIAPL